MSLFIQIVTCFKSFVYLVFDASIIMMGPFHTVWNLWYHAEIHRKGRNTSNFVPVISWVFACSKQVAWWNSILQRLSVMSITCVRHPENSLKYVGNEQTKFATFWFAQYIHISTECWLNFSIYAWNRTTTTWMQFDAGKF